MAPICCVHRERPATPPQAIRLTNIDPAIAYTFLPADHPDAVTVKRPPSVNQALIRSPSLLSKLRSVLPRKSMNRSLTTLMYDEDNKVLESRELLEMRGRLHERSASSCYSQDDSADDCRVFDGCAEDMDSVQDTGRPDEEDTRTSLRPIGSSIAQDVPVDAPASQQSEKRASSSDAVVAKDRSSLAPPLEVNNSSQGLAVPQIELSPAAASRLSIARPAPSTQPSAVTTATSLLTPSGESLADYERKLSVCGDDRRKESSCDLQRYREMKEEDKALGLEKPTRSRSASRATKDTLISSALERQLQEKALFRSQSKAETEVLASAPAFLATSWEGASFDADESIGPLDDAVNTVRRSSVPESWCCWPSHSRAHRAGVAGVDDDVIVRDFAMPTPYADRAHLKSPTVLKLKNVKRYYTDLLTTSGFHGKGHRTSVFSAGKLQDPELELLPPSLPDIPEPSPAPGWVREQSDGTNDARGAGHLSAMYVQCLEECSPSRQQSRGTASPDEEHCLDEYRHGTKHWRGLSMVSERSGMSEKSFFRESSHDLLALVEEERRTLERLIMG